MSLFRWEREQGMKLQSGWEMERRREGWGVESAWGNVSEWWVQDFFHILLAICCESRQTFVTDSIIRGWYYIWSNNIKGRTVTLNIVNAFLIRLHLNDTLPSHPVWYRHCSHYNASKRVTLHLTSPSRCLCTHLYFLLCAGVCMWGLSVANLCVKEGWISPSLWGH